jgi:hypothetical protein
MQLVDEENEAYPNKCCIQKRNLPLNAAIE